MEQGTERTSVDLVYSEIRDLLRRQELILDRSRGVAGTLLAVATFALSFLGSSVLDRHGRPGGWFWGGLILIIVSVFAFVWVITPLTQRQLFFFSPHPRVLLEEYLPLPPDESREHLARHMAGWVAENDPAVEGRYRTLKFGSVAMIVGILILLARLGSLV